jgi:uncharacterized protein YndB with AHSA1/START domain
MNIKSKGHHILPSKSQSIRLTRSINAPPKKIYAAFTEAGGWRQWCCETAEAEATIGGKLHIYTEGYHAYGEFQTLTPNHAVTFTWDGDGEPPSLIDVSLIEHEQTTILEFKVAGLGSEGELTGMAEFLERTWGRALDNLKAVLE